MISRLKGWLDHLDPFLALVGGAAAGLAGIFGLLKGDALAAATLLVLSVVGFALYRERSLRLDARKRLEELDSRVVSTYQAVESLQSGDPFRMLVSETVWDIAEVDGSLAHVTVRRRIRFNQNNVFALYDFAGGDGSREETYSRGEKVHEFVSDGQTISIIAFNRFFSRNDEIDFVVNRTARDAFLNSEESVGVVAREKANRSLMKVIWPTERQPVNVRFVKTTAAGIRQAAIPKTVRQENGRPICEVEILEPELGTTFKIEWDW